MKLRGILVGAGITVLVGVLFLLYRSGSVQAQPQATQPGSAPCCSAANIGPRELDFPYYSLANGYSSKLLLVSDSPKPIDLTIAIRNLFGQSLLDSETIQPLAKLPIDLASTVAKLGGDPTGAYAEGSVAVYYIGTIMPVAGQMTVTNPALSLTHQVNMVENDPGRSDIPPVLNGLWWGLGGGRDAQVMVSNTSMSPVIAEIFLDYQGKRHSINPVTFAPNETKVLDINQLLAGMGVDPAEAPSGGITIISQGSHPALIASGRITDPATGFSTTIDFPDPRLEFRSALHATGLPLGTPSQDSPFAGGGTFTPQVVVRNLLPTAQAVTITIEYPQPENAGDDDAAAEPAPLDPIAAADGTHSPPVGEHVISGLFVPGYATEDFSLSSIMGQLPLPLPLCSIRIQYSGPAGSVEAEASSVEQNQNLIVDALVENEGNGWLESGVNPWHLDKDTDSVLFLTNMGDKAVGIGFKVNSNGVHYYITDLRLNPHETRAIDIRTLRDAQRPDVDGNKIPAAATDGSLMWVRCDNVPVEGRLMVIRRGHGLASSYDCTGGCPCPTDFAYGALSTTPGSATIVASTSTQLKAMIWVTDCNNNTYQTEVTGQSQWTSSAASVATVYLGDVTGKGGGTTDVTASFTGCTNWRWSPTCVCEHSGTTYAYSAITVQVPTSLRLVSTTSSGPASCASGYAGWQRHIVWQVLDQSGKPINQVMSVADSISIGSPKTCGGSPFTAKFNTNGSGEFGDYYFICSTGCAGGGSCQTNASQTYAVNGQYKLPVSIVYKCTSITLNGQ